MIRLSVIAITAMVPGDRVAMVTPVVDTGTIIDHTHTQSPELRDQPRAVSGGYFSVYEC